MKKDALSRRLRFAPPNPQVKRLVLTETDYLLFEAINRHGPLPSNYLYEFTKHQRKDRTHLQNRLTEFYNGDDGGPYLTRPQQQFAGYEARYQHLVYDLTQRARVALAERGTLGLYSPKRTEAFLHQLMQACTGASLELALKEVGLRYITREEILTYEKCPQRTRDLPNPMAIPLANSIKHEAVTPDDLFGIEYPGVGLRFFALEIDRNTESIERRNPAQNSFGKKVTGYLDILRNQTYRHHFGIPNLSVLTVTTNPVHAMNILDYIRRIETGRWQDRFAFAVETAFGANWSVPKELLRHLVHEPWKTVSGTKHIDRA